MTKRPDIVVVDDDCSIRDALRDYLERHGYSVRGARDSVDMDRLLSQRAADLVVLDWMMPGEDGLSICRRLADRGQTILMLSALGTSPDRVIGLEVGADDYLSKPFDPRELLARIRVLLRRRQKLPPVPASSANFVFQGWQYQPHDRLLKSPDGNQVTLTQLEYGLLQVFVERAGRLLSRDSLVQLTRGSDADCFDRAIDLAVSRLRRKLKFPGQEDLIETIRGEGYRFRVHVQRR